MRTTTMESAWLVATFNEVIDEAENKFDHQSLSSLIVTCFIRERLEEKMQEWENQKRRQGIKS